MSRAIYSFLHQQTGKNVDRGAVDLEEAMDFLHRYLSDSSRSDDDSGVPLNISFSRSAEEFITVTPFSTKDVWVHWGLSIDGVPWALRPYCGSLEIDFLELSFEDAEERVRQFFTLPNDQLRQVIRDDIQKKEGSRWLMWAGQTVFYVFGVRAMVQAIVEKNRGALIPLLLLVAMWALSAALQPKRCRNCRTTVYDHRLRPDDRCYRCGVMIPRSWKEFLSYNEALRPGSRD